MCPICGSQSASSDVALWREWDVNSDNLNAQSPTFQWGPLAATILATFPTGTAP